MLRSARALLEVAADADVSEPTRAYATQQLQALHDAYRLALDTTSSPQEGRP